MREPLQDGTACTLGVEVVGALVGRVPFTPSAADSDDPFDPKMIWTVEGPRCTHADFQHETERPDYQLCLNAWAGSDDTAPNAQMQVSIRCNSAGSEEDPRP